MKNNTKFILVLVVIVCLLGTLTFFVTRQAKNRIDEATLATFSNIPGSAAYTDLNGNEISIEQYFGKILVVNSWASWSPFSATDLPLLAKLAGEFNSDEVVFLAINRKETRDQAVRFVNTLPNLGSLVLVLDPRDHFYASVGGYAMPEMVIYNQVGEIIQHFRGDANENKIREVLNQLLNNN